MKRAFTSGCYLRKDFILVYGSIFIAVTFVWIWFVHFELIFLKRTAVWIRFECVYLSQRYEHRIFALIA